MGTVKTSMIRVSPHYHVSLELLVPTTRAPQESPSPHCCLPDPFTTSPLHLLLLQAHPGSLVLAQAGPSWWPGLVGTPRRVPPHQEGSWGPAEQLSL